MLHTDVAASQAGAVAAAIAILGIVFSPRTRGRLIAFLVVAVLVGGAGGILARVLYSGYAEAQGRWDLRREGAAATGTILSVAKAPRAYVCDFEFRCADGHVHRGQAGARFRDLPKVGDAIEVRYLPAAHERAMPAEAIQAAPEPAFERALALYGLWGLNVLIAGMLVVLRITAQKSKMRNAG